MLERDTGERKDYAARYEELIDLVEAEEMEIIEILKADLFGIVERISEWLPISSTGHMILLNEIVSLNVSEEFYSMFEVVIQLGAILAVVILFWNQIWPFGKKDNKDPLG